MLHGKAHQGEGEQAEAGAEAGAALTWGQSLFWARLPRAASPPICLDERDPEGSCLCSGRRCFTAERDSARGSWSPGGTVQEGSPAGGTQEAEGRGSILWFSASAAHRLRPLKSEEVGPPRVRPQSHLGTQAGRRERPGELSRAPCSGVLPTAQSSGFPTSSPGF